MVFRTKRKIYEKVGKKKGGRNWCVEPANTPKLVKTMPGKGSREKKRDSGL